jgi:hypothetical protein
MTLEDIANLHAYFTEPSDPDDIAELESKIDGDK